MKKLVLIILMMTQFGFSQVGINTTTPQAQLDIKSSNQVTPSNTDGILIPKIDAFPLTNPTALQQGMMVYLTTLSAGKQPGFYYWDNVTVNWIGLGGSAASSGWSLTGDTGTNSTTNFIGTTDDNDLVFRRNNIISGKIATYSTSFGNEALFSNTTGDYNTAVGSQTLYNNTVGHHNMAFGNSALSSNTNGAHNVAFGFSTLAQNNNGLYNVAMGSIALSKNVAGISNTAIGAEALREVTGSNNTALGFDAGVNTTTGNNNIAIGANTNVPNIAGNNQMSIANVIYGADMNSTATGKIGIGVPVPTEKLEVAGKTKTTTFQMTTGAALSSILTSDAAGNATWQTPNAALNSFAWKTTGNSGTNPATNFLGTTDDVDITFRRFNIRAGYLGDVNTSFGNYALNPLSSGNFNTAFGSYALQANNTGSGNSANGHFALNMNTTGSRNIANGQAALEYNTTGNDNIGIGYSSLFANVAGNKNIAIGTSTMSSNKAGSNAIAIGHGAMQNANNTTTAFDTHNLAVGYEALKGSATPANNTGDFNIAIGSNALTANSTGEKNIALGNAALQQNTLGIDNIGIGIYSLDYNTNGRSNTSLGNYSLEYGNASNNTAVGYYALNHINANNNTGIGYFAMAGNPLGPGPGNASLGAYSLLNVSGTNNTAVGFQAGDANTTGSNNITIGADSDVVNPAGNNQMSIANVIYGADMSTTALGKIGIGVPVPTEKLEVAGKIKTTNFQMTTGAALNRILVSDASGNGTWVSPSTIASGTLDQAYDFGGAGLGRTITADAGALTIAGTDGLVSTGTFGSGIVAPAGAGIRMVWNPRNAAFRAGKCYGTEWDDANIGEYSIAFGNGVKASGDSSIAFGIASDASGAGSTAFGGYTIASAYSSTAFGYAALASGNYSTALGFYNTAPSFGETVLGLGATLYTPSTNGATRFANANATDRLLVVGNAIDTNNNTYFDTNERSDALVILKNGNTGIGNSAPALAKLQVQGAVGNTVAMFGGSANSQGVSVVSDWPGIYFNSYYSGGTRAMSNTGYPSIINTDQSSGALFFQTTNVANTTAGLNVGTIPTRMTITGSGNIGIGTPAPGGQFELSLDQGRKPGSNAWTVPSDERLKTIHGDYTKGLEEIIKLQPITYNYKNTGKRTFEEKTLQKEFSGFSAQAVQKIFPEAVGVDDDGFLNFNMHPILVATINAFKELDLKNKAIQTQLDQIKTQQEEINSLKAINAEILKRLEKLENK